MKIKQINRPTNSVAAKLCGIGFLALFLALSGAACSRNKGVTGPAAAVQTTTYHGVGVVKGIDPKRPAIEIDHEDIKDLMPAMTMAFYVNDASLLNGVNVGDHIKFTLENGVGGIKVTEITHN